MTRRLLNLLTALSLLLCVAVVGLWVRSYHRCDTVSWSLLCPIGRQTTHSASRNKGTVYLVRYDSTFAGPVPAEWERPRSSTVSRNSVPAYHLGDAAAGPLGFDYADGMRAKMLPERPGVQHTQRWRTLAFPLWVPAALLAAPPTLWLRRHRRRRRERLRRSQNRCARCGYDLRATPGRCPECGNPPVRSASDNP